jgi:8-oxo-dGTP pyrophosphatase MutT (NUDIX family)
MMAVGVWFYAVATGRYLYLMRVDDRHPNSWGLPGGKVEPGESLMAAMVRECEEEMGAMPEYLRLAPIEKFTSADGVFSYHTFFCSVAEEFEPKLNAEHSGYAWLASGVFPKPMHPGLYATVNFDAVQTKISTLQQSLHG